MYFNNKYEIIYIFQHGPAKNNKSINHSTMLKLLKLVNKTLRKVEQFLKDCQEKDLKLPLPQAHSILVG